MKNIRAALGGTGIGSVKKISGRLLLSIKDDKNLERIMVSLSRVFGIAHFSRATETKTDLDSINKAALRVASELEWDTFKVSTKRSNKEYPQTSMEVSRDVGQYILENMKGKKVKIKNPDLELRIEIVEKNAYILGQKIPGPGGLPVGVSGKVVSLLSGGIDSPVASWMLMKRGCDVVFVHFESTPQTDRASVEKVKELALKLSKWQRPSKIHLVPFLDIQKEIVKETKGDYRVLLYRRFMYRLAEAIAETENAKALVTGESVGQVASQTLENIAVINDAIIIPVLRPLIGMDKEEIIERAKVIDTYELSIIPHDDCCSLFVPRHPVTKGKINITREEESKLEADDLIAQALTKAKIISL